MEKYEIELDLSNYDDGRVSSEILIKETGEAIGSMEGTVGVNNQLVFAARVNKEYHSLGIGYDAFKQVFDFLANKHTIELIVGSWNKDDEYFYLEEGRSTNLVAFQKSVEEGMTEEEAALNTPTGKWAVRLGYCKVKIVKNDRNNVDVVFTK